MIWVEITLADVIAHLPTDIKVRHDEWLATYPEKADRLATLTANTIREFRDAIKSNPANVVDPRETYLPQSAVRHAENIIIFNLAMEMGVDIDSAGNSARTSADVFLRQIPYGKWNTTTEGDAALPGPLYTVPVRSDFSGRALPMVAALMLLASTAFGGWIKPGSTVYDTGVNVTYAPSAYTNISSTLFGHLYGINAGLASLFQLVGAPEVLGTGYVARTGSSMSGPLALSQLRGTDHIPLVIEAGNGISSPPHLYLRAGTNSTSRGFVYISSSSLQSEPEYELYIRGGYSPFQGKNVVLEGGDAGGNNPRGKVEIRGQAILTGVNNNPARFWVSTNSYIAALNSLTSLYFVVLHPPSTNRIDL
ncbi:MAG TPA: hypothetical protein PKA21_08960 [Kiritimatiellia bacterium]|nr:hypothetical protein [Kiritimatiellia bacterium]HMP35017.1 hypothetical protein [Kiritimatiellia bacterium]